MSDLIEQITDFVLGNIGIVIFAIFILSGFLGRGNKAQEQTTRPDKQVPAREQDNRPLAERLAEHFGVEIPEEYRQEQAEQRQAQPKSPYASEGRRSTSTRNVQQQYPDLFGGPGMFDSSSGSDSGQTKWGFDETEWGSTFERTENQWGNTFSDRKDSEPRIEWPR